MKFCPNCGAAISPDDIYCGMCGQPLMDSQNKVSKHSHISHKRKGKIYTDTNALATKLKVSRESILHILTDYINSVYSQIEYELCDYCAQKNPYTLYSTLKTDNTESWIEYHKYLYRQHFMSFSKQINYLFIIGGDDTIPVPIFPHFTLPYMKDVPADILYGYSDSITNDAKLESILHTQPAFHVGRLPLGTDATIHHLEHYLEGASKAMEKGIPVQMAYAQCDPNWKRISEICVSELSQHKLIPEINANPQLIYNNIFLSPFVTEQNINEAFNPYANLYYFNLHGSNDPKNPNFIGKEERKETPVHIAITPKSFEQSQCSNIIVTEACYGGKHANLGTAMSMLLTSMCNNTLLYLGSSRVAYGAVDNAKQSLSPYGADVIAKEFVSNIMNGFTAGEALHAARKKTVSIPNSTFSLINEFTILEFSLYGDPSLTARFPNSKKKEQFIPSAFYDTTVKHETRTEVLYTDKPNSILAIVRNKINSELQNIHNHIQDEFQKLGYTTRKLSMVIRVERDNLRQKLFYYETESGELPIVVVDEQSGKQDILMPKSIKDIGHLSINYRELYEEACQRYGLIQCDEEYETTLNAFNTQQIQIETVKIDNRIEKSSKRQIETFNKVLNDVYRPSMENANIYSLSIKTCDYDFALLVNPLSILLETELKESIVRHFENCRIFPIINGEKKEWTLGRICKCMRDNKSEIVRNGISDKFVECLYALCETRNDAAHEGNIREDVFLAFYLNFKRIVKSSSFTKLMDLKIKLRKLNNKK